MYLGPLGFLALGGIRVYFGGKIVVFEELRRMVYLMRRSFEGIEWIGISVGVGVELELVQRGMTGTARRRDVVVEIAVG